MMDVLKSWFGQGRSVLSNRLVWLMLAIGAGYWVVVPWIEVRSMVDTLSIFYFVLMIGLAVTYVGAALRSLADGESDGVAQWLLGIVLFSLGNAGLAAFSWVMSRMGFPNELYEHALRGFFHLTRLVGACLLVTATASTADALPMQRFKSVLILVLGVAASIAFGYWVRSVVDVEMAKGGLPMMETRLSSCPVVGTKRSMVYHDASSPYRPRIKNGECFQSASSASAAGYRRWKD